MPRREEFSFSSSAQGNTIHADLWLPEDGAPRAVVLIAHGIAEHGARYDCFGIAHGIAEHGARYDCFGRYLAQSGFAVAAEDHLGHGKTMARDGDLGFFASEDGWQYVVRDLHTLHLTMTDRFPDVPCFLLGHSMGSFLARTYLLTYPGQLAGCILSGTAWQSPAKCDAGLLVTALERARIGRTGHSALVESVCFGAYNRRCRPKRTDYDWLTHDEKIVDKYVADPMCGFIPTVQLMRDMLGGIKTICTVRKLAAMDRHTPVLLAAGTDDPVGDYGRGVEKTYRVFCQLGMEDVQLKLYPGDRHEILNELDRDTVYSDLLRWLEQHLQ